MLPSFRKALWLFGTFLFLLIIFLPGYTKLQELRDKNRELEKKIIKVYKENANLQQQLSRIESDPVYQEKIAREKMGVVRKGEVPLKVVPAEKE